MVPQWRWRVVLKEMILQLISTVASRVWGNVRPNFKTDDDGKVEKVNRSLRRGQPFRRVIAEMTIGGVEFGYHATKGWRAKRVSQ